MVEKGNPLGIKGWDDLTRDDVDVVTADPATSGAARWNVMALYHHAMAQGDTEAEADDFLIDVFGNVTSGPPAAARPPRRSRRASATC